MNSATSIVGTVDSSDFSLAPETGKRRRCQLRQENHGGGTALETPLTTAEIEVMRLLIHPNATEASIATELGIEECTVHTHTLRAYNKLGTRNRYAALLRFLGAYPQYQHEMTRHFFQRV